MLTRKQRLPYVLSFAGILWLADTEEGAAEVPTQAAGARGLEANSAQSRTYGGGLLVAPQSQVTCHRGRRLMQVEQLIPGIIVLLPPALGLLLWGRGAWLRLWLWLLWVHARVQRPQRPPPLQLRRLRR